MNELSCPEPVFIVVTLDDEDRAKIESHLLRLSKEDRYLRFFAALGDYQIKNYAEKINLKEGRCFGVLTLPDRKLVGMAHVSKIITDGNISAELGISVDADMRGHGFGRRLMDRAVTYCAANSMNRLFMSCLRENKVMQKLAKEFGLRVVIDADEALAELDVDPKFSKIAAAREISYEQISLFDKAYRMNSTLAYGMTNLN